MMVPVYEIASDVINKLAFLFCLNGILSSRKTPNPTAILQFLLNLIFYFEARFMRIFIASIGVSAYVHEKICHEWQDQQNISFFISQLIASLFDSLFP